jgi:hypothetical protein
MKNFKIFCGIIFFISIQSVFAISITMHIQEDYNTVQKGERLYYDVEVKYPENPNGNREDVTFTIQIISNEEIIAESKLLKAIETQISFTDYLIIPKAAKTGKAIINIKVENFDSLSKEVRTTFYITNASKSEFQNYFYILLSVIIIAGIIIFIEIYYFRKRCK